MIDEKKRQYIKLGLIGIVAILAIWTVYGFATTGRLTITAPDNTPNNSPVTVNVLRNNAETDTVVLQPGETKTIRTKSGNVRVDAVAETLRSVDIVSVKRFFQSTSLKAPTGENHATEQLASDTLNCPILVGGATYSYACEGDGPVVLHQTNPLGTSLNSALFNNTSFSMLQPLKNGLIGVYTGPNAPQEILYLNLISQTIQEIPLPEQVSKRLRDYYPIITAPESPASTQFSITFVNTDDIFLFDDVGDQSPVKLKLPEDVKINQEGRTFNANFHKDHLLAYFGTSTEAGEGEDGVDKDAKVPELTDYIVEYDKTGKLLSSIQAPAINDGQGFYKLTDDLYAASTLLDFSFYYLHDGVFELIYQLPDVGDWAYVDGTAYFQANGTIYKLAPGKEGVFGLHSTFVSSGITASQIFNTEDGLMFTGFTEKSEATGNNIYRLLDKTQDADTANKPDSTAQNRVEPTYEGLNELLDAGVSFDQITNLRYALSNYASQQPKPIKKIRLTNIRVPDWNPDSPTNYIDFGLFLDGTIKEARLDYADLSTSQLTIFNLDGSKAFDSGFITNQQPETED